MIRRGTSITRGVSGLSGGWTQWGTDTVQEIDRSIRREFTVLGWKVDALRFDVGDDLGSRVIHNSFPYTATITARIGIDYATIEDVESVVKGVFWNVTDSEPNVSRDAVPQSHYTLPKLPNLNLSLGLIAVVVLGVAIVLVKVKP